jgi:hypothetical protein
MTGSAIVRLDLGPKGIRKGARRRREDVLGEVQDIRR